MSTFTNAVLVLAVLGLVLNMGCVHRKPKNFLRSQYSDKAKSNEMDTRKYAKGKIPPPVKVKSKTEKPKKKFEIWPLENKGSAKKVEKVEKVSQPKPSVKVEQKEEKPKKSFRIWPFGKKTSVEKTGKGSSPPPSSKRKESPKAESSTQPESSLLPAAEPYRYRLKYGDSIVINLRGVAGTVPIEERIDENGNIKLDYIGSVQALGKTSAELEDHIERAYLDQKIYRNLSVSVQLPMKSYFIRGEVLKPGRFSLLGGVSIVQAIATAGGFNDFANIKDVVIIRGGKNIRVSVKDIERNPSRDVQIEEGDVIVVKRSFL